jgi:Uncharacterized protein conserved in bacteria (DUF2059)
MKTLTFSRLAHWMFFVFVASTQAGNALAQLAEKSSVETYFRKSGLDRQLKEMEKTMPSEHAAGMEQVPNLSAESKARALAAVKKIFTAEKMDDLIRKEFQRSVSNDDLKQITAFYSLKVATEIVDAEIQASSRDAAQRQARMTALMEALPKGEPKRWETYKRLESAIDLSDFMVTIMQSTMLATVRSVGAVTGRDTSNDRAAIVEDFRKNAAKMKDRLRVPMALSLVDTYSIVSDEALSRYVDALESPAGRRVSAATIRAFQKMFDAMGEELGIALGEKSASAICTSLQCERVTA